MQADLDAYRSTIEAAGITYHHAGIECCVVLDDHRVAGQADRLVTNVPGCELPVVADLKTGHDLFFSWGSIAIQLAIYAHASSVYRFGEARDGSEDRRIEMPAVDQTRALVIHLPAGEARCDLWWVDLEAGWEAFQIAMWQRGWRDRCRMLSTTVTLPPLAPSETATVPPAPSCELGVDQPGDAAGPVDRRADLQRRIDAIKAHDGVDLLIENWPAGVPTLRQSPVHSVDQLDRIALVLEAVEAKVLPFDPPPRELVELCPEDLRVTLVERFRALPDDLRAAVKAEAESRGLRTPSGQVFRTTDATDLEPVLVAAEEEHTQRRQTCAEALVNFEVDQIEAVFATVGYRNGQAIDATTAERICSVASALDTGLLELIPGMASLHAPTCIDRLVEAHGSKRALLSVARTAADGLGLAKPGSSAEIAAQPLLVAALAAGAEREEVKV
jgi:hypothetical protein